MAIVLILLKVVRQECARLTIRAGVRTATSAIPPAASLHHLVQTAIVEGGEVLGLCLRPQHSLLHHGHSPLRLLPSPRMFVCDVALVDGVGGGWVFMCACPAILPTNDSQRSQHKQPQGILWDAIEAKA